MKNLTKIIIGSLATTLALSLPKYTQAQSNISKFNISSFSSLSYKSNEGGLNEKPVAFGANTSYDFTENLGVGLQYRSRELWGGVHNKDSKGIVMSTTSTYVYASIANEDSTKLVSGPAAGVYAGVGFPLEDKKGIIKNPYFGGVFFQLNFGKNFSRAYMSLFLRTEGGAAFFGGSRDGKSVYSKAGGTLSFGLRIKPHKYKLSKQTKILANKN